MDVFPRVVPVDLTDSVALVTGAARGIGRACAIRLAGSGAQVVLHYNTSKDLAEHARSEIGENCIGVIQADLTETDAMPDIFERWPDFNLLVNNAGVYEPCPFLEPGAIENWQKMLTVNLMTTVVLSHRFANHFRACGGGKIINIASRAGFRGEPGAAAYAASKAAQINLTKSLAIELLQHNIYVYAIAPGWTETEMVKDRDGKVLEAARAQIPFGRMATPDEIGAAVAFLASQDADYLTGITLDINGASYIR